MKQPLNKYTFKAPKIHKWVQDHCRDKGVLNLFAGPTFIGECREIRNDMDNSIPALYHMDALDLVRQEIKENLAEYEKYDVIIIDPPYSYRKSMELYNGHRNSRFKLLLDELPKILRKDGKVVIFGYCASYMGRSRGFKIDEILVIDHSGAQHATLAVVESRI